MQKITPFLWFNNSAEEAMEFYKSVFKNTKQGPVSRYSEEAAQVSGRPSGSVMVGELEIEGLKFSFLNGGPVFTFTEATSFVVSCEDQAEVDYYWEKLSEGGSKSQCGWLKDKFGVSWQIIPKEMAEIMSDPDPVKSKKAVAAMMTMTKIDIQALKDARDSA
jgi:predicted 3-demethylubiquinone-9 3-methyltransferase (glyoxalase superfamily)